MTTLVWDQVGEREFETGVDHGVLYIPTAGVYSNGVAWNGLIGVTESPSGAEATPLYADNIKYLNMTSAEQFGATLECYTYPDEFAQFDGQATPSAGLSVGQQARKGFGLSYRTRLGNDIDGDDHGYKLHLVYGCTAAPTEKAYSTVNESPEAITFSYELATVPVPVTGLRPTSIITIDSTKVDATKLEEFEVILYGDDETDPKLPTPDEVIAHFGSLTPLTAATPTNPTYNVGTHQITIPTVTGITYTIDGLTVTGTVTLTTGQTKTVKAKWNTGYRPPTTPYDSDWVFSY
ncbi:hypothetical protein [uncultured Gordonia sp.]|uniref:hypothetical protein n=1 Tax=uncultured Gordonia sp. TaxID=198437 RepID=UPI0026372D86|nr:hypothetical protein [uncultured Gordonia sp.]